MKYRPVGGSACAPSAASDSGNELDSDSGYGYYSQYIEGDYRAQMAKTWRTPGSFQFCIWLTDAEADVATPFSQVITFRRLNGTITAAVSPVVPRPGQLTTFSITGSAEAPLLAFAKVRPSGGASCAASPESDTGVSLIHGHSVEGAFGLQGATKLENPGSYLLCLWLAQSETDTAPIAAQSQTFDVVQPPPVVKRARTVNCATKRRLRQISARRTSAVCVRYSFATRPLAGDRLTLRFVSTRKRTVKRVRFTPASGSPPAWSSAVCCAARTATGAAPRRRRSPPATGSSHAVSSRSADLIRQGPVRPASSRSPRPRTHSSRFRRSCRNFSKSSSTSRRLPCARRECSFEAVPRQCIQRRADCRLSRRVSHKPGWRPAGLRRFGDGAELHRV